MKTKLIQWLYNYLQPKYTSKQKAHINRFKSVFRCYFEGGYGYDAVVSSESCRIHTFEITDLQFQFKDDFLTITIVLGRPGILIGKGGKTIDGLNEWLKSDNMKITVKESKLWRFVK